MRGVEGVWLGSGLNRGVESSEVVFVRAEEELNRSESCVGCGGFLEEVLVRGSRGVGGAEVVVFSLRRRDNHTEQVLAVACSNVAHDKVPVLSGGADWSTGA